jgi:hypothetical protein
MFAKAWQWLTGKQQTKEVGPKETVGDRMQWIDAQHAQDAKIKKKMIWAEEKIPEESKPTIPMTDDEGAKEFFKGQHTFKPNSSDPERVTFIAGGATELSDSTKVSAGDTFIVEFDEKKGWPFVARSFLQRNDGSLEEINTLEIKLPKKRRVRTMPKKRKVSKILKRSKGKSKGK